MEHICYGVRSRCADGSHAILVDIDEGIEAEIRYLVKECIAYHLLSDFFIVKNIDKEQSYHLYCPTKVNVWEYAQILEKLKADPNFLIPLYKDEFAMTNLRYYSPTKGFLALIERIESPSPNTRMLSYAHLNFLKVRYGVDISRYTNHDESKKIILDGPWITQKD